MKLTSIMQLKNNDITSNSNISTTTVYSQCLPGTTTSRRAG
jgi:hypothetical protein